MEISRLVHFKSFGGVPTIFLRSQCALWAWWVHMYVAVDKSVCIIYLYHLSTCLSACLSFTLFISIMRVSILSNFCPFPTSLSPFFPSLLPHFLSPSLPYFLSLFLSSLPLPISLSLSYYFSFFSIIFMQIYIHIYAYIFLSSDLNSTTCQRYYFWVKYSISLTLHLFT